MPLVLKVISAHRESMGGGYVQEFAACGGTLGRSLSCDWPLPDSKRYISSRHAMIDYQGGAYYLVDLSKNGTFINGSNSPVGEGNPQRLFDGDKFRLGEFEISVEITESEQEPAEDRMRDSVVRAQMVPEDESMEVALIPATSIRDESVLEDALRPGDDSGEVSALHENPRSTASSSSTNAALAETADEFLRAAGLNPANFQGIDPQTLLLNAAKLLSEFTEGTHALLTSKEKIVDGLQISEPASPGDTNPLRSAVSMENAMRLLLSSNNDVHISGTKAVEAAFTELLQHQWAVVNAMRNALGDLLDNFEPESIEKLFAEHKVRSGSAKSRQAFLQAYAQAMSWMNQRNQYKLPRRFDEEFAKAYENELQS